MKQLPRLGTVTASTDIWTLFISLPVPFSVATVLLDLVGLDSLQESAEEYAPALCGPICRLAGAWLYYRLPWRTHTDASIPANTLQVCRWGYGELEKYNLRGARARCRVSSRRSSRAALTCQLLFLRQSLNLDIANEYLTELEWWLIPQTG